MQEIDGLYGADWVVCMDEQMSVIEQGMVAVNAGRIVEVGPKRVLDGRYVARDRSYRKHGLLMPGLVNTHTHAGMNVFRGVAEDMELQRWLHDHIFPIEARFMTSEMVHLGNRLAVVEMLRSGTTTFNDMYYFEDVAARLAKQMHIRAVLSEGLIDLPSPSFAKSSDGVAFVRELLQEYRNDELVTIAVAAHTPFTCSTGLLQGTKRLADEFGVPWHIHLAETRWEFDKYMRESGLTPTQYLDSLGVLGPNTVAAHGVHLTEGDMDLLALRGSGVAHNPVCNMKLASGVAPITPMWERGVTVGIATDGAASTNSLDLWKELRTAALLQKLITGNPAAAEASRMVRMATIDGARLLGLDSKMGSLEVGKRADMITVDLHSEHSLPLFSVYSHLVYSMNALDVREVWVDGHQVLRSGKFVTIDTDAIYAEIKEVSREIAAFDRSHNTK